MRRNFIVLTIIFALCAFLTPAQSEVLTSQTKMSLVKTINGSISPKSVRSSGTGIVSAHNMMYRHSVTIYDANTFELIKTISDSVKLSKFGYSKYSSVYKGAPVEGAYSPDGQYLYVTNYAMYGKGYSREGHDTCSPASNYDKSFLYRINLGNYEIDAVYPVGSVPKVVEVTPDKSLKIGRYPRGIAVSNDSKTAYVAEMGGSRIHVINLEDFSISYIPIGVTPRAIVLSPDNTKMYVTLNFSGKVAAWDLVKNKSLGTVTTGKAARSLAISSDGSALFVVNYTSNSISKVRTSDLKTLQTINACSEPIGVTFDVPTQRTWVACYGGSIKVFANN